MHEAIAIAAESIHPTAPRNWKTWIAKIVRTYPRRPKLVAPTPVRLTDEQIADLVEPKLRAGIRFGDALRPILKKQGVPGPRMRQTYGRIGAILSSRRQPRVA